MYPNLHSFQLLVQVQYIPIQSNSFRWHVMIAMRIYLTFFARGCRGGSAAGSRFDCHWAETSWSSLFRFCKWEWVWIKNIQTHILKFGVTSCCRVLARMLLTCACAVVKVLTPWQTSLCITVGLLVWHLVMQSNPACIIGMALWHDTPTTKEVRAHGSTQGNSWYVRV